MAGAGEALRPQRRLRWVLVHVVAARAGRDRHHRQRSAHETAAKSLVRSGASRGVLAFAGGAPVGWCAYARRVDLPKLQRSPSLACDDAADVWSIPCFFVKAGFRGKGIARALLRHALRSIRLAGGRTAEAY